MQYVQRPVAPGPVASKGGMLSVCTPHICMSCMLPGYRLARFFHRLQARWFGAELGVLTALLVITLLHVAYRRCCCNA